MPGKASTASQTVMMARSGPAAQGNRRKSPSIVPSAMTSATVAQRDRKGNARAQHGAAQVQSRPNWSDPSQCAADGGMKGCAKSIAMGS